MANLNDQDTLYTPPQAREYLRVKTTRTLSDWRYKRVGPRYAKIGGRVLYRLSDLRAYVESQIQDTTATG